MDLGCLGTALVEVLGGEVDLEVDGFDVTLEPEFTWVLEAPGICEHRFCSQTKTRGDRNCTACFSLANIFNQSTNKSFGAKLQSEVTGGFTQVRIGNLINQSATSCAISIPPQLEDCSEQKTFKDLARRRERGF